MNDSPNKLRRCGRLEMVLHTYNMAALRKAHETSDQWNSCCVVIFVAVNVRYARL